MQITNSNDRLAKLLQVTENAKNSVKPMQTGNSGLGFLGKLREFGANLQTAKPAVQEKVEIPNKVNNKQDSINNFLNINYSRDAAAKLVAKNFHLGKNVDFVA